MKKNKKWHKIILEIYFRASNVSDAGSTLLLTLFALYDSFATACTVTGDAAIALLLSGKRKNEDIVLKH